MLKIWANAIYKWLMNGVIIVPERPLGVTIIGVSLLHPAIVILFEPVILSWKLAVCGALIVFSIGILKGKRSAFYILVFLAIFSVFQAGMGLLDLLRQPVFLKSFTQMHFFNLWFGLFYNIAVLIIFCLPKSINFFYPELNNIEEKKMDKDTGL